MPKKKKAEEKAEEAEEVQAPLRGLLIGNKVIASGADLPRAHELHDKGAFGEAHGVKKKRFEYALIEALYLAEKGRLNIFDTRSKELNFEQFVRRVSRIEKGFWTRYQVYRDIRTRGYIVKTALKFGADFRVYSRGIKPGEGHAKWVLFCTAEGDQYNWRQFAAMNRVAHSTRKKLLIGVVDEEGEVSYWEVRWKKP